MLQGAGRGGSAGTRAPPNSPPPTPHTPFLPDLDPLLAPAGLDRAPRLLGSALVGAHLLARAYAERPALEMEAPAWFEALVELTRQHMRGAAVGAPPDTLPPLAALLGAVLGGEHPLAREAAALGEANTSAAARAAREERERARTAALAASLLKEEWPDEAELRAARAAEREATTPVPERCWALRNVASTLALGGASERGQARHMLEKAVLLKQRAAGAADHPSVLPELAPLAKLLAGEAGWEEDAAGAATLALRVYGGVADAYAAAGDAASAVALLEAAVRRHEKAAGVRHPAVAAATRRSEALLGSLDAGEREAVAAARRGGDDLLARVVGALTEELGAYVASGGSQGGSRAAQWDERGVGLVGPLV